MKTAIRPTIRQKRAVDALLGKGMEKPANSMAEAMRRAEYKPSVVNTPQHLTDSKGFKALTEPLLKQLEKARQQAIEQMAKKVDKASYFDATNAVGQLSKQIQLLTGGATEQVLTISISKEIAEKNGIIEAPK